MNKRLKEGLIGGVLLGILCVIGVSLRSGFKVAPTFVFALWYNRVILGLLVGAPWPKLNKNKAILRGAVFGLIVSFAFYASSGFADPISFLAGIIYGIILELYLGRIEKKAYKTSL